MNTKALLGRTRRARKNLAFKLLLEKRWLPQINKYFNDIVKDFKAVYLATGAILPTSEYKDDTNSLLKIQYKRVAKLFSNEMRDSLGKDFDIPVEYKQDDEVNKKIETNTNAALAIFINKKSKKRGSFIDATTQADMQDSIDKSKKQLSENNEDITPEKTIALATVILKKKFDGRKSTINVTETQYMAESTKQIEASAVALNGEINVTNPTGPIVATGIAVKKKWAAVLDEKTRMAHVEADGQTRHIIEPYIVNGEQLMYPGDRSLGASPGNTVNCRCSSLYEL